MRNKMQQGMIAAILLLGLSTGRHLASGTGAWTYAGLGGEYVNAVAVSPLSPTMAYAGTRNGLFKTTNGGADWVAQGLGGSLFIYAVVIDPTAPSTVYVGANGGVFKTTNDGADWKKVNSTYAYSLAIDPIAPATVYVGTSSSGVLKTVNGGADWSPAATGLPSSHVRALAINPEATSILYAATDTGIYKSIDGGLYWGLANTGIPPDVVSIYDVAVDPIHPTTVYAGLYQRGVYKSTNEGESWSPANDGFPNYSWYVHEIVIDPVTPSTLYAALSDGVFRSINGGGYWSSMSTGLTTLDVRSLGMDSTRTIRYAGTGGGGVFVRQAVGFVYLPLVQRSMPSKNGPHE